MTPEYYGKYNAIEKKIERTMERKKGDRGGDDSEKKNAFMVKMRKASNNLSPCLKCDVIMDLVNNGQKTIIYSEFLSSGIDIVKNILDSRQISYLFITGSVPKGKRAEIVEQINDPNGPKVLFITKAGGEGLDLRAMRQVILMEKGWTVESEEQVIGRAVRFRSHLHLPIDERNVTVYHLIIVKPEEYKFYDAVTGMIKIPTKEQAADYPTLNIRLLRKYLSADLYMFEKSRTKKIATDHLVSLLQKYDINNYQCEY